LPTIYFVPSLPAVNSDQHAFCEKHLPGRSADENKLLRPYLKAIDSAENKVESLTRTEQPATQRGVTSRLEKTIELRTNADAVWNELRERLKVMETERLALLPVDAVRVQNLGRAEHDHSEDRYKVVCFTSTGEQFSLGGCATLGDAQSREQWFERALKTRPSSPGGCVFPQAADVATASATGAFSAECFRFVNA
jgi:hypothetical protein